MKEEKKKPKISSAVRKVKFTIIAGCITRLLRMIYRESSTSKIQCRKLHLCNAKKQVRRFSLSKSASAKKFQSTLVIVSNVFRDFGTRVPVSEKGNIFYAF